MKLKAEQFVVFKAGAGQFEEFGYQFKEEGHPDALFSVVLGAAVSGLQDEIRIRRMQEFRWVADAIVEAALKQDKWDPNPPIADPLFPFNKR